MTTGYPDFWRRAWMVITMYFITLKDTPHSYVDQANKIPAVKATEDGLEFISQMTLPEHKALHENGGGAEINVTGLSGVLADPQHVIVSEVIDLVYPVGSIYISMGCVNPWDLFGVGTWIAFASGRVLVGRQAPMSPAGDFGTCGNTGGEQEHELTIPEMPAHTHSVPFEHNIEGHGTYESTCAGSGTEVSGSAGSGVAHNNLQPYIVVCMWRRTA